MKDPQKTACEMHEALVSYLYDEASPDQRIGIETHLSSCESCRQELHGFERVRGVLQQWQLNEMPMVRFEVSPRRSLMAVIRELFSVTPVWAKAVGAAAMVVLFFAIAGTEVSVGNGGFQVRMDLFRKGTSEVQTVSDDAKMQALRAELISHVGSLIAENEKDRQGELRAELVSARNSISSQQSSELTRLEAIIRQQRQRLESLERDADRREGFDMSDILLGEVGRERSGSGTD